MIRGKILLCLLLLTCPVVAVMGQENVSDQYVQEAPEKMPEFVGGMSALMLFINQHPISLFCTA